MKFSNFLAFIALVIVEAVLCISFFYIYSNKIQNSYINNLKDYSKDVSVEFKIGGFNTYHFSEDVDSSKIINDRLDWVQSNYRATPSLIAHIYRDINTNEVIFSNIKNENLRNTITNYIRQWKLDSFNKNDYAIFNIEESHILSILNEIDDGIMSVGNLELIYNYTPVKLEIDKLRNILIWLSSSLAVILFIVFMIIGIATRNNAKKQPQNKIKNVKLNRESENSNAPETIADDNSDDKKIVEENENEKENKIEIDCEKDIADNVNTNDDVAVDNSEKIVDNIRKSDNQIKERIKELNLSKSKKNVDNIHKVSDQIKEELELEIKDDKSILNLDNTQNDRNKSFLKDTKNKKRSYVHKVNL